MNLVVRSTWKEFSEVEALDAVGRLVAGHIDRGRVVRASGRALIFKDAPPFVLGSYHRKVYVADEGFAVVDPATNRPLVRWLPWSQ